MNLFRQYVIILVFIVTNVIYASLGFYFSMVICSAISLLSLLRVNAIHQAGSYVPFSVIGVFWYALLIIPVFQYAQITESVLILGSYLVSLGLIAGIVSGYSDAFNKWKEETVLRLIAVSEFIQRTHSRPYSHPTETLKGDVDAATVSDTQRWISELYDAGIDTAVLHEVFWGMHNWSTVDSWINGSTFGMPEAAVWNINELHRYFCDLEEFDIEDNLLEIIPEEVIDKRTKQLIDITHDELVDENNISPDYTDEGVSESK